MKVALICNELSREGSAKAAAEALREAGHDALELELGEGALSTLRVSRPDVVFNAAEGEEACDGSVQDLAALAELPCVGATAFAARRAHDASQLTGVMEAYWAQVGADLTASWPYGVCVSRKAFEQWGLAASLDLLEERIPGGYPLCVKPVRGASGVRVESPQELAGALRAVFACSPEAVVRQFIEGVELSMPVIGSGWDAYALPPVEAVRSSDGMDLVSPVRLASLSPSEEDAQAIRFELERAALEAYRAFGMRDYAIVDMIWDGGQARVMGLQTAPSMADGSAFRKSCAAAGISLPAVLNELVELYA